MKRVKGVLVFDLRKVPNVGRWVLEKYPSNFTFKMMAGFSAAGAVLGGWEGAKESYGSLQRHKENTFEGVIVGAVIGTFAGGTWPISIPVYIFYKVLEVSTRQ